MRVRVNVCIYVCEGNGGVGFSLVVLVDGTDHQQRPDRSYLKFHRRLRFFIYYVFVVKRVAATCFRRLERKTTMDAFSTVHEVVVTAAGDRTNEDDDGNDDAGDGASAEAFIVGGTADGSGGTSRFAGGTVGGTGSGSDVDDNGHFCRGCAQAGHTEDSGVSCQALAEGSGGHGCVEIGIDGGGRHSLNVRFDCVGNADSVTGLQGSAVGGGEEAAAATGRSDFEFLDIFGCYSLNRTDDRFRDSQCEVDWIGIVVADRCALNDLDNI